MPALSAQIYLFRASLFTQQHSVWHQIRLSRYSSMMDTNSFIGDQLGNYRVITKIASGGFASVFKGKHTILTERIVAIKVLHATHLHSTEESNHFLQEARFLEKLKHPYILPILDVGIHEGFPYLVTEYASSGSLSDYLKRQSAHLLPLHDALTILSQIGQALHYAHQHHIVHRDLKPDNILFNVTGEALLADFGIAKLMTMTSDSQTIRGTPAYMAPEQFDGLASMKSDQYSLGCIAYELLTGQKPFSLPPEVENKWLALGYRHKTKDPIPPTQLNTSLPIHVEQAILKSMAKEREERYADIPTFIRALGIPSMPQTPTATIKENLNTVNMDKEGTTHIPQDIPSYITNAVGVLDSANPIERKDAIKTLAQTNHPAAHEELIKALQHPVKDVRAHAALALAPFKDLRAIPGLFEAITVYECYSSARMALKDLGDEGVPIMLKALHDKDVNIRRVAVEVLEYGCFEHLVNLNDGAVQTVLAPVLSGLLQALQDSANVNFFFSGVLRSLLPALQDNDVEIRRNYYLLYC